MYNSRSRKMKFAFYKRIFFNFCFCGLSLHLGAEEQMNVSNLTQPATEEVDEYGLGLIVPDDVVLYWESHQPNLNLLPDILQASADWSMYDSPVKNQGGCGSCWAFAAVSAVENLGIQNDLAEQVLVSCVTSSFGCSGGWYEDALDYFYNDGVPPESCYPYTATNGNCTNKCSSPAFEEFITGYQSLWGATSSSTVNALKNALYSGPVIVGMAVPTDGSFQSYSGGIYNYTGGYFDPTYQGHAVLCVGYNDDGQYFRVKNSWGPSWGEGGYFRIAYNDVTDYVMFGKYGVSVNGVYTDYGAENILVTSPNGGETWPAGSNQNITWTSSGTSGTVNITYTDDAGLNWHTVTSSKLDDGSHAWTVPQTCSSQCAVIVWDIDGSISDMSDGYFTIDNCGPCCDILAEVGCPDYCELSQIDVPIRIDMSGMDVPNNLLGSYTATLTWDPTQISYVLYAGGTTGGWGAPTVNAANIASGHLGFSAANPTGTSGLINILNLTFDVIGSTGQSGTVTLAFDAMASALTFVDLLPNVSVDHCDYTIDPCGFLGDVNGDEVPNSTDALIIMSCDVGLDVSSFCPMNCGDVNGDGMVNSTDALIVVSYDVGLTVPYPVGDPGCPNNVTDCAGCN